MYGAGRLIPSFESNISDLSKGDKFSFSIEAADAYGERREDMIIDVPLSVFMTDGKVDENICRIGNQVPMVDTSGNPLTGTILEIGENDVTMDFNHPMAGTNLFFTGIITDISEPTPEDINPPSHSCSGCNTDSHSDCAGGCSC
jgi:FKBP-type peptidyl-prolyl cis-trans isomerase SlyD